MIGNKRTKKVHADDCISVYRMKDENRIDNPDPNTYDLCVLCHARDGDEQVKSYRVDPRHSLDKFMDRNVLYAVDNTVVPCDDPRYHKVFDKTGCVRCGTHYGILKMYPHTDGVEVMGHKGKWWVYFECNHCGYESALWKAKQKIGVAY